MRNKGAILLFAILLSVVCLYQLTFTFITNGVREDSEKFATVNGTVNSELQKQYLDSMDNVAVYPLLGYTFKECKKREINLGLDLKGGMNVILEISPIELLKNLSGNSDNETFVKALELTKKKLENSQEDFLVLFGQSFTEVNAQAKLSAIFSTYELKDKVKLSSTNEEVIEVLTGEIEAATANAFMVLRARIDRFGVVSPNIQRLQNNNRILLELPGVKNPERVRKLLEGSAKLEFWETYENSEVISFLAKANQVLTDLNKSKKSADKKDANADSKEEADDELSKLTGKDKVAKDQPDNAGALFSYLQPAYSQQYGPHRGATVGYVKSAHKAKVDKLLAMPQVKELFPRDLRLLWSIKPYVRHEGGKKVETDLFELVAIKSTNRNNKPALDGEVVVDARREISNTGGRPEVNVSMSMNAEGSSEWARITKNNVGRQVAVVLDNYVYSHPNVNEEITGGSSRISGDFSMEEGADLANVLKSGKLPAPARIIQEAIVGPSLGQEAIDKGLSSFIYAIVFVLLFMFAFYNVKGGSSADIALVINMFFIFGVLSSFGAVLTLPGLAGIVLTIGMSVDANVLIFERINEEHKLGKGLLLAISDGYKNANSAIIDANITTLITAVILYAFGTGPIKGFATTLIIGILTSLFSAIFITRIIIDRYTANNKPIEFTTKFTSKFLTKSKINFIEKRKLFYVVSAIFVGIGIFSLVTKGLDLGIDFTGGRTYVVRFDKSVNTQDVSKALAVEFGSAPDVKTFGGDNQVKVSTNFLINSQEEDIDNKVESKLFAGLESFLPAGTSYDQFLENNRKSSEKVGPTIADDIKQGAFWALLFSLIAVFVYILFRFKKWQYSLGAIVALVHDSLFILGLFSLFAGILPFSLEIDQAFIAAILTVIGYSINDTVVVFDRLREYMNEYTRRGRTENMNAALNSTLRRTFNTSLTTFIVLLTIFMLGGETIRGFVFALMVGVIVGTYSSLFIATPISYDTDNTSNKIKAKRAKK
jgi:SecD/SecF fusion protein